MDFTTKLRDRVARVEAGIERLLPAEGVRPARLHAAMRYSLQAGGKRLRPVLVLATAELFDPEGRRDPLPAAVAIECVHTYSLVHDDLPCMDNDDLRRGRATAHKAFDEATALLAGDALLTYAFELVLQAYAGEPSLAAALGREMAEAAGSRRLIGGQMEDLLAEGRRAVTEEELDFIHREKTAAMIELALVMGARLGGASDDDTERLRAAGRELGRAFQIVDDVLDATADSETLGKTAGKDARAGKATAVSLFGLEGARERARRGAERARALLDALPGDRAFLIDLAGALTERRH
jgi:geranylgeranyl diphosphate synthase, type II